MMKWIVTVMLSLLAGATHADALDVNFHDDAIRAVYGWPLGGESRGLDGELGVLYTENSDFLGHAGFLVSGANWDENRNFQVGLGVRLMLADVDYDQAGAFAFGGRMRLSPLHRVGFGAEVWYAPNVTTFIEGERMHEYSLRADYQLLPHAFIYVGYRDVEIRFEDSFEYEPDSHAHVGMQLFF